MDKMTNGAHRAQMWCYLVIITQVTLRYLLTEFNIRHT